MDQRVGGVLGLGFDYMTGPDFDALATEGTRLPIASAVDALLLACQRLAEAHVSGTVERELEPASMFLAHYASPEQMQSASDIGVRSDIWSLGAIAYELIAGRPPFRGSTIPELYASIVADPVPALSRAREDVSPPLEGIVLRCLEKDPLRRFGNVAELACALTPFGTESALESAARISRIVEGGSRDADGSRGDTTTSRLRPRPSCVHRPWRRRAPHRFAAANLRPTRPAPYASRRRRR